MKKKLIFLLIVVLGLILVNKTFAQISFTAIDVSYTQDLDAIFGINPVEIYTSNFIKH